MTQALLVTLIGIGFSILVEVVPGFKDWWGGWKWKRLALLVVFLAMPLVAWAFTCFTDLRIPTPSDDPGINGAFEAIQLGIVAFLSSQGIYHLAVSKLPSVRARNGAQ